LETVTPRILTRQEALPPGFDPMEVNLLSPGGVSDGGGRGRGGRRGRGQ
jgi:hypothetical protein